MAKALIPAGYPKLLSDISRLLEEARRKTVQNINTMIVQTYWEIGRRMVEEEQRGSERAEYRKELVARLAADLTSRYGRGFDKRNLWYMRQFYLSYPKVNALRSLLTWTHYRSLMRISDFRIKVSTEASDNGHEHSTSPPRRRGLPDRIQRKSLQP